MVYGGEGTYRGFRMNYTSSFSSDTGKYIQKCSSVYRSGVQRSAAQCSAVLCSVVQCSVLYVL